MPPHRAVDHTNKTQKSPPSPPHALTLNQSYAHPPLSQTTMELISFLGFIFLVFWVLFFWFLFCGLIGWWLGSIVLATYNGGSWVIFQIGFMGFRL